MFVIVLDIDRTPFSANALRRVTGAERSAA